jgi:hypothetical protein
MAIYKFVLTTWLDSTLPGDGIQITPTFSTIGGSPDLGALADDLLTGWNNWLAVNVRGTQQRCTVYNWQGAKPNYPQHQEERFTDVASPAPSNRELALCLSGYHNQNRPRQRGRLYIPVCFTGQGASGAVASGALRTKVAELVPLFTNLGGIDVDWGVYSRVDNTFRKYTHWFVDDAWDVQRRRGSRATARTAGTTGE